MESAEDISKKVTNTEKRFDSRYRQMDADFDTWDLKQTEFDEQPTAINVTSNDPRTFADDTQTDLASAEMQIMVRMAETEGEDKREDIGKLERLFYFLLEKADERLIALMLPPLREYLIWCSLVRGCPAARILVYKDEDKVIPDFLPFDPRWLTYEVGSRGFSWVNYKTFKTKSALQDEWGYTPSGVSFFTPWVSQKETYPMLDYWEIDNGQVTNSVICEGGFLKERDPYNVKAIPVLIMPVPVSPPIVNSLGEEVGGYGESIFASKRGAYELQNKLASMWATHANILGKQPLLNYIDDEGKELKSTILYAEGVYNLPMGHQRIEASPLKEISPTLVNLVAWVEGQIERASLPHLRLGQPPPSGTALNLVREAGARIYNPQVRNLNRFYAAMCRLIEEQLITNKIKVKIESEKEHKYFGAQVTPVDLKKPHIIKVEFTVRTPWTQMDVAQQAQMLKALGLPDGWIWENILKVQDPKGLADLAAIELFEHSPKGAMKRAVEALIETRGDVEAAQSLVRDMDRLEAQERMATGETSTATMEAPEGEMGAGI